MADQIMTVSKEAAHQAGWGCFPASEMHGVDMAMRIQLGLVA